MGDLDVLSGKPQKSYCNGKQERWELQAAADARLPKQKKRKRKQVASENLLRVAFAACDARRALVRLRFSAETAAARDGLSRWPIE
jgi:hypothetical protein